MGKQNVVYIHTMEYYLAMTWSTDTYYNMDEPWKHYVKFKKPLTKDHIFYDSTYGAQGYCRICVPLRAKQSALESLK